MPETAIGRFALSFGMELSRRLRSVELDIEQNAAARGGPYNGREKRQNTDY